MLSSISTIASQVVGKCKKLVEKHGSEIALVGKVAISTLIPGGGLIAEVLEHTCDEIKDKQNDLEQKSLFQQLEANIVNRLGNDSAQFLQILDILDRKLSDVISQMVDVRENMDASAESLSQLLLSKIAKSPELMQMKENLVLIGAEIKVLQGQNQKLLDGFKDLKADVLESIKEQIKIEMAYSPANQVDGLSPKDATLYLYTDRLMIDAMIRGDFIQARKHLNELVRLNPQSAKTKTNQALLALIEKRFEDSEKLVVEASQKDPTNRYLSRARNLANQTTIGLKVGARNLGGAGVNHIVSSQSMSSLQQGHILGNKQWQLIAKVGIGGMGMVWEVKNSLNRKGALKVLLSGQQDIAVINQFKKEIDTLENINHEGIVKIIDWGEDQIHKIWYMVMELIEGESLATYLLKNAPIQEDEGLRLLEEIAKVLVVCQENGIVHRDIKPANIMLRGGLKQPILIDFGIAKQGHATSQYTSTIMLTEAYAAPEQKIGDFSHQSDLYALARTMIECFLPKNVQLISLANPLRYVPQSIWQYIEHLLDEKEHRGDAKGLLGRIKAGGGRSMMPPKVEIPPKVAMPPVVQMIKYFYYFEGEDSKGPVGEDELVGLIVKEVEIFGGKAILIWFEGLSTWVKWDTRVEIKGKVDEALKKKGGKVGGQVVPPPVIAVPPKVERELGFKVGQIQSCSANGVGFNMVYCPAGEFWMGTDDASLTDDYWQKSKPKHKVKMNKGFWMGETQVTQDLWQKVMGWNPSGFKGSSNLPVEYMTWYDCLVFCNKLSELEKFKPCFILSNIEKDGNHIKKATVEWLSNTNGYRLPTEAEWEYSAKAGTESIYSGSNNVDEVAWYFSNSGHETHEVKTKKANGWGLYDMNGNVDEWCMDKWDRNAYQSRNNGIENPILWDNILWDNSPCARVLRGVSYANIADFCRVAYRHWDDADHRRNYRGLRLLRCEP
jgi:formylglycine-generating enzyme required for sulfatase activity/predicted Ser/Thr protein kinase